MMRTPVAAIGWPMEMPEPFTFVRSKSRSVKPHSRVTASTWAANASFSSMRSMSFSSSPACASAFFVAGTGPMPMYAGCTPADRPGEQLRPSA